MQPCDFARYFLEQCRTATAEQRGKWLAAALATEQPAAANLRAILSIRAAARDKHTWDALDHAAKIMLQQNAPLPRSLAAWIADRLTGACPRPRRGERQFARGLLIGACIEELVHRYEMHPTRRGTHGPNGGDGQSACDAVAEVIGRGYKDVETIWTNWRPERIHLNKQDP